MFPFPSPNTGDKRKRPSVDSERTYRPNGPPLRLSPSGGHRIVQAMAQPQSMPFFHSAESSRNPLGRPTDFGDHEEEDNDDEANPRSFEDTGRKLRRGGRVPSKRAIAKTPLGRPYVQYKASRQPTGGPLIPDGWTPVKAKSCSKTSYLPCPVRNCPAGWQRADDLSRHFNEAHGDDLFNDNRDGTISATGKREKNEQGGVIISQIPHLPGDDPPDEPKPRTRPLRIRLNVSKELVSTSSQGLQEPTRGASVRPGNDEQVGSNEFGTAWDAASQEDLAPRPSKATTTGSMPKRLLTGEHTESRGSARHTIPSCQSHVRISAASVPLTPADPGEAQDGQSTQQLLRQGQLHAQAPETLNSQHKRTLGSQAVSSRSTPTGQEHRTMTPQAQAHGNAAEGFPSMHHAYDGTASREGTTADDAQALPADGQAGFRTIPGFQDIAWGLFNGARNLEPDERAVFPDRVEAALSLMDVGPDILGTLNRISDLPRERQVEDSRKIVALLRQLLG